MTFASRKSTRPITASLFCLGVVLLGAMLLRAQQPGDLASSPEAERTLPDASEDALAAVQLPNQLRLSEGTKHVDELGYFKITGKRVTFFAQDSMNRYIGLENLNLQRIHEAVAQKPGQLWEVSGMFTEYFGDNYLFVERAVLVAETDLFSKSVSTDP